MSIPWRPAVLLATALTCAGCAGAFAPAPAWREAPRPALELAGRAEAFVARDWHEFPIRRTADEGRPGDLVLRNEVARFVVSGSARGGVPAGCLLDAAVQGGEDRLRALVPVISDSPPRRPIFHSVRVTEAGGPGEECEVLAEGTLAGEPGVKVRTVYRLEPGSEQIEVATTIENGTRSMLALLRVQDRVYHGRTLRYAPGTGLASAGEKGSAPYVAFFAYGWASSLRPPLADFGGMGFGVYAPLLSAVSMVHREGWTELSYGTMDVPPRASRTYTRYVVVAAGGPEGVWHAMDPAPDAARSRLGVWLRDGESGKPVPSARVALLPGDGRRATMMVTDEHGWADAVLRAGTYRVAVSAPGRAPIPPVEVTCVPDGWHRLSLRLAPTTEIAATVRVREGGYTTPASARVCIYPTVPPGTAAPKPVASPYPGAIPAGKALADGLGAARLLLAPPRSTAPASGMLVATKGPLFEAVAMPVMAVVPGPVAADLILRRIVEPDGYLAVDARVHTEASPDGALTLPECLLCAACEGLDAVVTSDPAGGPVAAPAGGEVERIAGLRLSVEGVGYFSVYPVRDGAVKPDVMETLSWGQSAGKALDALRRSLPDAIIQVDAPLDAGSGYFVLAGVDLPGGSLPGGVSRDFDAIELLTGADVAGARRLLPVWFALLNEGRRVAATGGSGARTYDGVPPGVARTFVRRTEGAPSATLAAESLRALRDAPDAFVTNGPFVEATLNGKPIGSTQTARGGRVRLLVRVQAPPWMDVDRLTVYRNGVPVVQADVPPSTGAVRCDRAFDLDVEGDSWFVIVVEGTKPMLALYGPVPAAPTPFAVTNPFWVDADGDGLCTPAK